MYAHEIAEKPIYKTAHSNESVRLYDGNIEINQGKLSTRGVGSIRLDWDAFPIVRFQLSGAHVFFDTDSCDVILSDNGIRAKGQISRIRSVDGSISGYLEDGIYRVGSASTGGLKYIIAHAVNFTHFRGEAIKTENYMVAGRLNLAGNVWNIIVDHHDDTDALLKEVESTKGFGLTHVVRIERKDGSVFSCRDAEDILFCLGTFFSLLCGYSSAAILPVGFDSDGRRIWEKWNTPHLEPRLHGFSWFPELRPVRNEISQAFAQFAELWKDLDWKKAIQLAIYWYVTANGSKSVEASIMLYQVGLEVVSWYMLAETINSHSKTEFKALSASDRIRELLNWAKITLDVPMHFRELLKLSNDNNLLTGPAILAYLRNKATHPTKNNTDTLLTLSMSTKMEALALARWYLELSLLRVCEYNGLYMNRTNNWEPEDVPWK